jgi:adenylate cyclase
LIAVNGYEVEGEGANFVCAFGTPDAAVRFALQLQENLMLLSWSREVLATPWTCEELNSEGKKTFRGPRVAIGMSSGTASRSQICKRTGRMEFYGPVLNQSARVAASARGGQVRPDLNRPRCY